MPEIEGVRYQTVFFDFDGVITDTNTLRKRNINALVVKHLAPETAVEFVSLFTANI